MKLIRDIWAKLWLLHLYSQLLVICHIEISASPPPLLLTPRSRCWVRSDVMCRAGSEQRVIEPATGYCSNEATHPAWTRRAVDFGTHEGVLELMKVCHLFVSSSFLF